MNWKALVSTDGINARDNVGGYGTSVPVYLATGAKVANDLTTSTNGLWSGAALTGPYYGIDGAGVGTNAWTGSFADGAKAYSGATSYGMGNGNGVYGSSWTTGLWIYASTYTTSSNQSVYGLSEELTVAGTPVPEIDPAGMGSVFALVAGALGLLERCRLKAS